MSHETNVDNLFRQVELVPRVGERRESELCVMSLVALMAGDRHTDRPATACPVIASFGIKINDTVDCDTRQGLKLMAPRIIGTNDGRKNERAWLLVRVCVNEVFPYLMEDAGGAPDDIAALPRMPIGTSDRLRCDRALRAVKCSNVRSQQCATENRMACSAQIICCICAAKCPTPTCCGSSNLSSIPPTSNSSP
jgi:hypothetical protein